MARNGPRRARSRTRALGRERSKGTRSSFPARSRAKARYLKLEVQRSPEASRLLLGEIVVEGPAAGGPPAARQQAATFTTPMQVKRTLDQALIKAKVPFLFWCYATELLRDAAGKPAGVVISTRSGRQAVFAKVIIDATERGNVARMAGAAFTEYPAGVQTIHAGRRRRSAARRQGAAAAPERNAPGDHRPERRSLPGARV